MKRNTKQTTTLVTGLLLLLPLATATSAEPIEITPANLGDGCAAMDSGIQSNAATESDWILSDRPDGTLAASKEFTVPFASQNARVLNLEGAGDPKVGIENCSSGACAIVIHVYEKSVSSVKAHAGLFGFLPWAYAKVVATQEVQVEIESEITCAGEIFVTLTGSGGLGPRTFSASIWKDDATQQYQSCTYLNVPEVDEECTLTWAKDFELTARTPGEWSRFDVVNGGQVSNRMAAQTAASLMDVIETPEMEVGPVQAESMQFGESGQWRVTLAAITAGVDTNEAIALLEQDDNRPTGLLN